MGAVNGIYLPIHKHDQLMKLLRIKKIIRSHRYATKMLTLFRLKFNYTGIFIIYFYYFIIYIRELSWKHDASMSIYSVIK